MAFILIPRSVNHLQSVRSREELGIILGEISVLISRVLGENSDDILDVNKINWGMISECSVYANFNDLAS